MAAANYRVIAHQDGWGVDHDGQVAGPYATKEAAFETVILPASNAIKQGWAVNISVAGSAEDEPALGAS